MDHIVMTPDVGFQVIRDSFQCFYKVLFLKNRLFRNGRLALKILQFYNGLILSSYYNTQS